MANQNRYQAEILRIVWDHHLTAQSIHQQLKKTYFFVWIGTIYRNLQEMADQKLLLKTIWLLDQAVFEKYKEPHAHAYCKKSHQIFDVTIEKIEYKIQRNEDLDNFEIQNIDLIIRGELKDWEAEICISKW